MIPREVFYERRDRFCKPCEFWKGACLKGHPLQSAQGCPIHKFPPIAGADYAADKPVPVDVPQLAGCCGGKKDMPPISWADVMMQFAGSMASWAGKGFPVVSAQVHGARYAQCKACPKFVGFYCDLCRCVAYLKTKVATEKCPANPPKWV